MNKRLEDRLIAYAFGDVTPEEALVLEQEARRDSEASALLADYKRIKTSMVTVQEIPPHQLSSERLKEAILREGLAPKRTSFGLRWVWAPVATAAVALYLGFSHGLLSPRQAETSGTPVAVNDVVKAPETAAVAPVLDKTSEPKAAQGDLTAFFSFGKDLARLADEYKPRSHQAQSRHAIRTVQNDSLDDERNTPEGKALENAHGSVEAMAWMQPNLSAGQGDLSASARNRAAAATRVSDSTRRTFKGQPILMIQSGQDASTDLPAATEVSNSNDVVLGG